MMKTIFTLFIICILTSSAQAQKTATSAELQKWIKLEKEESRASYDDNVLIVVVQVKEKSKTEFDIWVKDVLYAALYNSKSEMKKAQLKTTRWLDPLNQNKDGTWTYTWIMDPIIPNTNYDILAFLVKEMV